jgi:medium-chain acyl-[acyl-carrier-protein] hydrolase
MASRSGDIWFPYAKPNPTARARLICFPYAGGSALVFRNWINCFGPNVEVCVAQLPGRGRRLLEAPFTSMDPAVDALANVLSEYLDKPLIFFGHSMGALIGFELAHRILRERKGTVLHLFASGRQAPQIPPRDPPTFALAEPEFIKELHRLKGTPPEVLQNQELLTLMLPVIRSDFELVQTYRYSPKEPLKCGITAIGGSEDDEVRREDLEAWREHSEKPFDLLMFPGDHFFLHSLEKMLLRALTEKVEQFTNQL